MNADGSDVRRLTDDPAEEHGPIWSPDGSSIMFTRGRPAVSEVYVMTADGSDQRNITSNDVGDWSGDWSALGTTP